MPDEIAIARYIELGERVSAPAEPVKPKISKQQEYWQDRAVKLSLKSGKDMAVIKLGNDHYQVYPLSICKKDIVYTAKFVGGASVGSDKG